MTSYRSTYDVAILGSGLGGLTTAALLARKGTRVIVLEEKPHPGGSLTVSQLNDIHFTRGPVLFLGMEKDGYGDRLFSELGLSLSLIKRQGEHLLRPSPYLQVLGDGFRINLEIDQKEQMAEYRREWATGFDAIRHFLDDLEMVDRLIYPHLFQKHVHPTNINMRDRLQAVQQAFQRFRIRQSSSRVTALNGLSRYRLPEGFMKVLESQCLLWYGKSLQEATLLDVQLHQLLVRREVMRPVGGLMNFCGVLVKVLLESRGQIHYSQTISSIQKNSRKNWEITLKRGEKIHARYLVIDYPWERFRSAENGRRLTFFFAVDPDVIPASMGGQVLITHPMDSSPWKEGLFFLSLSLQDEELPLLDTRRLLQVTVISPVIAHPGADDHRNLLCHIQECLQRVMPFSESGIHYIGDDRKEQKLAAQRWKIDMPFRSRLRFVKRRQLEYAHLPFNRSLFFLPDLGSESAVFLNELRSADEIAMRLLKRI